MELVHDNEVDKLPRLSIQQILAGLYWTMEEVHSADFNLSIKLFEDVQKVEWCIRQFNIHLPEYVQWAHEHLVILLYNDCIWLQYQFNIELWKESDGLIGV